ncbi:transcriptional regulator with XRE-family HTH domain [Catenulispora sp. MAP5-51]|uniref:helix-turn-helix transcriptional regulator n=1 Tax=Catenulispora sp. MAP5-51 TaxID=3156298 RepID=UPI003515D908
MATRRQIDRPALGAFLRRRREALSPDGMAPPSTTRRRTPGMRREEVADLAGMSVNYYERLERATGPQPSDAVLDAIARTLRLSDDEIAHLYALAGHGAPRRAPAADTVDPGLRIALDALAPDTAGLVLGRTGEVLAANVLGAAIFGGMSAGNIVERWFTDRAWRDALSPPDDQEPTSRAYVADLRASLGGDGDPAAEAFIRRMRTASAQFSDLWDQHEVAVIRAGTKVLLHPRGRLDLECAVLPGQEPGQRLTLFRAAAHTPTAARLPLIAAYPLGQA